MMRSSQSYWYQSSIHPLAILLLPLSWLFAGIVALRRWLYQANILPVRNFPVPVIVVGNLTVGGTGKTPCVMALAAYLKKHGYHPGIVSRGIGGRKNRQPVSVTLAATAVEVGDEALLIVRTTGCPMAVCVNRSEAVAHLLRQHPECDVVISDDGLQHYQMGRAIEVVVVDGMRKFGNRRMLPAGPLREPVKRLKNADFTIVNGGMMPSAYTMSMQPQSWISLKDNQMRMGLDIWQSRDVHAVAGIGNPQRFFNALKQFGYRVKEHVFPDHYRYREADFNFDDGRPVLMTRKDAVKCESFAGNNYWYLDVIAKIDDVFLQKILQKLKGNS